MLIGRVFGLFQGIVNYLWPDEATTIDDFIGRIRDAEGNYRIEVMLKCVRWSDGNDGLAFVDVTRVNHYHYYFIARAISLSGKRDVTFSEWVDEGTTLFPDENDGGCKKITAMEDRATRAAEEIRRKIKRVLPDAEVKIIRKRSILDFGQEEDIN